MTTSEPSPPTPHPPRLQRRLGLWQTTVSGVGIVIGAGIYVLIGDATAQAGSLVWAAFLLAALVAGCTGVGYAELAGMFPSAGAESEFARRAFGDIWGFLAGWLMAAGNAVGASAVALGFGTYLREFVDVDPSTTAVVMLIVLSAVVAAGVERSIWFSTVLVALQVGGLVLVIAVGLPDVGSRPLTEGTLTGVLSASALVFFAFIGFDEVVTLSDETRDAERVIPRALLLSLGLSTALYVVVGVVAVSSVDWHELARSDRPLALVLQDKSGNAASSVIACIALASTLNTTLLLLTSASRLVYSLAAREWLPPRFAQVGRRTGAPQLAVLIVGGGAICAALGANISLVAALTDFTVYAEFLAVDLSLLRLRSLLPEWPRPMTAGPAVRGWPIATVVGLGTTVAMLCFLPRTAWLLGCAITAAGAVVWMIGTSRRADGRSV